MLVRAIALSLALLIGIGVIVPMMTDDAEARPHRKARKHRHHRHYKKYSKRWWRQYHRRQKRLRAIRARKRALRLRRLRLARARAAEKNAQAKSKPTATKANKPAPTATATLPSGDPAPSGWRPAQTGPSELQFRVDNSMGEQVGSASISVVGPAMPGTAGGFKTVGGVSTAALRRDVIDRMIRENGWVVNDYQKDISGQQVYIVVAQSQAKNGALQSRMFYFTEVDGRIYSVATNSPVQEAERLADESEKVINSLKNRVRPTQRASK
jgi:hypothetical protein